jgi:hypothetical protein
MKRQGIVVVAVLVAVAVAGLLVLQRGKGTPKTAAPSATERVFVDDSLGVRLRLPDSPGWSLRREPPGSPDGRVVTAVHTSDRASVRLVVLPAVEGTKVEEVFEARKKQVAPAFSVDRLDKVIARVIRDETQEVNGRPFLQWQAQTHTITVPGEKPATVIFFWLMTVRPPHSIECLGTLRFAAESSPEEQAQTEALLNDLVYMLQSFEVR